MPLPSRARRTRHAPRSLVAVAACALATAACGPGAVAQTYRAEDLSYRVVPVVEGLEHPWGMAFLPDGAILVTERPGRLRIVRGGRLDPTPIAGVPEVRTGGQGGLLDVSVHPDFASNRLVYLTYSKATDAGATTALARGRLDGGRLTGVEDIFVARTESSRGVHFGSRIAWAPDGSLFMSIGDRGVQDRAQDPSNHHGVIVRLRDDGSVPPDNPLVGRGDALPEVFAYGIRSPQGLAVHPETGELWETEHGPRGGDEINVIRPGANYGWPVITWGINYNGTPVNDGLRRRAGLEQPLHYWDPSIATSGLAIYTGDAFPAWRGSVFVGGLAGEQLARVEFDGTDARHEETLLAEWGRRIRDVRQGPDGLLYLLVDAPDAPLVRLEPAP